MKELDKTAGSDDESKEEEDSVEGTEGTDNKEDTPKA